MADEPESGGERGGGRKIALVAGLGLIGIGAYQLTKKAPATPAPTPSPSPTPNPSPSGYMVTAQPSLIVRSGPGTSYSALGALPYGTRLSIVCQGYGSNVVRSAIWDQISSPWGAGWVSDWYVSTPGVGVFTPGLSQCGGGQPAPGGGPGPSGLPPTGQPSGTPPISDVRALLPGWIVSTGCGGSDADYILVRDSWIGKGLARIWIKDAFTWQSLGAPRNSIRLITKGVLYALRDGGTLVRQPARNAGLIWTFYANPWGWVTWGFPMPPPIVTSNAGYCS